MLTQAQLDEIKRRITENLNPNKIILFGSYATGTPTEASDIDLLIVKDSNLPTHIENRKVRKMLSDLKIPVDVIVKSIKEFEIYKEIIGTIIYSANKFGKVIYESR